MSGEQKKNIKILTVISPNRNDTHRFKSQIIQLNRMDSVLHF